MYINIYCITLLLYVYCITLCILYYSMYTYAMIKQHLLLITFYKFVMFFYLLNYLMLYIHYYHYF